MLAVPVFPLPEENFPKGLTVKVFSVIAAVLLVAGCSTVTVRDEPRRVDVAPDAEAETAALAAALLAHERGVTVESLEVTWKDKTFPAEMVVKGDGEKLTVVLLSPQMRLATLTLTVPHAMKWERAPQIPNAFAPEYAIADIAFVRLPVRLLSAALGAGFSVRDDGERRVILHNGRKIRELCRLEGGAFVYSNPIAGYSCKSMPMEAE